MDKRIILYAFKICFYYFLKTFLPIMYFGSKIDYSFKLDQQIEKLKTLIHNNDNKHSRDDIHKDTNIIHDDKIDDNKMDDNMGKNIDENTDKNTEEDMKQNDAIKNIKKSESIENLTKLQETITSQLRDRYGNDVIIDFTYNTINNSSKSNIGGENTNASNGIVNNTNTDIEYALKIKRIGGDMPDFDDYAESEIFVHTEKKVFYIRTKTGFRVYPLNKKSIIKCVK